MDGEEWKGEEPKSEWPSLFGTWTVTPLTPEEKEALARRNAEAAAKAEILFPALPEFERMRLCPKCRNPREAKTRYCAVGTYAGGCNGETGTHEHFHRTCRLCRYEWLERCLGEEP